MTLQKHNIVLKGKVAVKNTAMNRVHLEQFIKRDVKTNIASNNDFVSKQIFSTVYTSINQDEPKVEFACQNIEKNTSCEKSLAVNLFLHQNNLSMWNIASKGSQELTNKVDEVFGVTYTGGSSLSTLSFNAVNLKAAIEDIMNVSDEEITNAIVGGVHSLINAGYSFNYRLKNVDNVEACMEYGQLSSDKSLKSYWSSHVKQQKIALKELSKRLAQVIEASTNNEENFILTYESIGVKP